MPDPSPSQPPSKKQNPPALASLVRAESMMGIAFILPSAVFVGWIAGVALDRWLHQHWIYLAGIILGAVAGFVQVFRLVFAPDKDHR